MHKLIQIEADYISDIVDFSQLQKKKILITGASGLVGLFMISAIAKYIEDYDIELWTWTNTPIEPNMLPLFDRCHFVTGDICDSALMETLPTFDVIIHSSGYGQPSKFLDNKIKTIQINTTATVELFNHLVPGGKFLYISSSEVYNGLDISHVSEDMVGSTNTDSPRSCYIEGKKCGEAICNIYKNMGYDVKIARLCLAFGPGTKASDQRVINNFIKNALTEHKILLLDHGDAIRTYCYITDAVEMMWNVLLHGKHVIYNIGGESKTTILNLAKLIGNSLGVEVELPDIPKPLVGNPKIVNIDCSRYHQEFNKKHFIDLETGISKTIQWQKQLFYENNQK
jgi:nucleoside-diphosphate-sugar epimerase